MFSKEIRRLGGGEKKQTANWTVTVVCDIGGESGRGRRGSRQLSQHVQTLNQSQDGMRSTSVSL